MPGRVWEVCFGEELLRLDISGLYDKKNHRTDQMPTAEIIL